MKTGTTTLATKLILLLLFICGTFSPSFSQNGHQQIDELINEGNFEEAIQLCKTKLEEQPDNPDLNFKIGYCYMNTPLKKAESIPFLVKANEIYDQANNESAIALETQFYLGKANRHAE